jgi:hypothetical protein
MIKIIGAKYFVFDPARGEELVVVTGEFIRLGYPYRSKVLALYVARSVNNIILIESNIALPDVSVTGIGALP